MTKPAPRDITLESRTADEAAKRFNPGEQCDIADSMRASYQLGYMQCLIDYNILSKGK